MPLASSSGGLERKRREPKGFAFQFKNSQPWAPPLPAPLLKGSAFERDSPPPHPVLPPQSLPSSTRSVTPVHLNGKIFLS